MDFSKDGYRALILSANDRFGSFLAPLLEARKITQTVTAGDLAAAGGFLAKNSFDFILINSPLPDGNGYRLALDASKLPETVVFVALPEARYAEASASLSPQGVYLLQKPLSARALSAVLDWMLATRARFSEIEGKRLSIEEKMKELSIVNRAKWLLIDKLHMTEPEAHYHIEKQAMDRRLSKREVAEEIIRRYG